MDYGAITKRAWIITKKYRFLWWLGFLSLAAEGSTGGFFGSGNSGGYQPTPSNQPDQLKGKVVSEAVDKAKAIPRVLGTSDDRVSDFFHSSIIWMTQHWLMLSILLIIFIIIYLLIIYIAESAKAGLILSVQEIEKTETASSFGQAFHSGKKFAWRLFGQTILINLIVLFFTLIALAIVFLPYLISHNPDSFYLGLVIGLILLIPLIIVNIFTKIWLKLSSREMVLSDSGIGDSLRKSQLLFRKQIGKVLLVWLIETGLTIAVSLVIILGILLLALFLFGIGFLIYILFHTITTVIFGIIAGFFLLSVACLSAAIFNTFLSSYWTLSCCALAYINTKPN